MKTISGPQLARIVVRKCGFVFVRQSGGSHAVYEDPNDPRRRTVIPMHNRPLPPGTQRAIMRQVGLTPADLM